MNYDLYKYYFNKPKDGYCANSDNILYNNSTISRFESFIEETISKQKCLVILIGGPSCTGKSSLSVELARFMGIRSIVSTDVLRYTLANHTPSPDKILSYFTHECWKVFGTQYSPKALTDGYNEQCRKLLPSIQTVVDHSSRHLQNTIIEGVHLTPENVQHLLFNDSIIPISIFLTTSNSFLKDQLIPCRVLSTYRHRKEVDYESRLDKFYILLKWWEDSLRRYHFNYIDNSDNIQSLIDKTITYLERTLSHELE